MTPENVLEVLNDLKEKDFLSDQDIANALLNFLNKNIDIARLTYSKVNFFRVGNYNSTAERYISYWFTTMIDQKEETIAEASLNYPGLDMSIEGQWLFKVEYLYPNKTYQSNFYDSYSEAEEEIKRIVSEIEEILIKDGYIKISCED